MRATLFFRNWSSLISIMLSIIIIVLILGANFAFGSKLEERTYTYPTVIQSTEQEEVNLKVKNYLTLACSELVLEFNNEDKVELAKLITLVLLVKNCNLKEKCISEEKFEIYLQQFERGFISQEEFAAINEEYSRC